MKRPETRSQNFIYILTVLLTLSLFVPAQGCDSTGDRSQRPQQEQDRESRKGDRGNKDKIKSDVILEDLDIPWSIAFLSDKEAIITERNGLLSLVNIGNKGQKHEIERIAANGEGEGGLLGVAIHPDFKNNKYIYLYFTYRQGSEILNRVERYEFNKADLSLESRRIIIEKIPGNQNHNGGRIKFGPDKKLYIATGDALEPELAQDRNSLAGKILRLNDDGTVPSDNPFNNSPVYSLGHRNPQGIAWRPQTNDMYATEHGQSANDEVNKIEAGKNYGWPEVSGSTDDPGFTDPVLSSGNDTWAPSGADFFSGRGRFDNDLFFATLRGNHIHVVSFTSNGKEVDSDKKLFQDNFGRIRDVVLGPDNALYLLTSNRDGRGDPSSNDDRLIRLSFSD